MRGSKAKALRKACGYDVHAPRNYRAMPRKMTRIDGITGPIRVADPNYLYYKHTKKLMKNGGN